MPGYVRARGKRANGTTKWQARWRHPEDRSERREKQFRRKDEAKRWLVKMDAAVEAGTYVDPRIRQTFGQLVDEWRGTWGSLGPKTKAGYDHILEKHVLPRWRKALVSALAADRIQAWINDDIAPTRSADTVRNVHGVMRRALALAVERRHIVTNPCDAVRLPSKRTHTGGKRRRKKDHVYLSPQQIARLAAAVDPHWSVAVTVDAHTGLRAGELWALRRCDLNPVDGRLTVERSLKQIETKSEHLRPDEKGLVFGPPKSEAAQRTFTLPGSTLKVLRPHLEAPGVRAAEGYAVVREQKDGGWRLEWSDDANDPNRLIFTTANGYAVRHNLFYRRVFQPAVRRALPALADYKNRRGLTFHDLRHTCASLTLSVSKGNFYIVKERLGHEDIQTTVNTYGHLVPHADEAIANSMSELFEAAQGDDQADNVHQLTAVD